MVVEYFSTPTDDKGIYLLHGKDKEAIAPTKTQLKQIRRLIRTYRALFYARQLNTSAESRAKELRQKIVAQHPEMIQGVVARFAKQWLRVIITPKSPKITLEDPIGFVDHVGKLLPKVASSVSLTITSTAYLEIQDYLVEEYGQGIDWNISGVDFNKDRVNRLVQQKKLAELPVGMFKTEVAKEPNIDIKITTKPA